jgi:hypothetical protein
MLILAGMVAVTWPEVNTVAMFIVLVTLAITLPFFTYGPAYCMWQAIDILLRPPEPDDFEIVGDVTLEPEAGDGSDASSEHNR